MKTSTQTVFLCRLCRRPVDHAARFTGWSDLAVWAAEQAMTQFGTICDPCWDAQATARDMLCPEDESYG